MKHITFYVALALSSNHLSAEQLTLDVDKQTDLSLTLYSQNLGLVQDSRTLGPLSANDQVIVRDVSQQMLAPSLQIFNAGTIVQQSLKRATLSYHSLLNSYIGRELTLAKRNQNSESKQLVKLLNISNQTAMVEINNAIEAIPLNSDDWRFIFPSRPQGMLLKPSLTFKSTGKPNTNNIQLSYLTQGLQWQMDYVLQLNTDRDALQLKGLATLYNNTDTVFSQAKIRLLAGTIAQTPKRPERVLMAKAMADAGANNRSQVQGLGDFYLYKLKGKTSLYPQQQVQVPLLQSKSIAAKVRYRHSFYLSNDPGGQQFSLKPEATLYFDNKLDSAKELPLPAGEARVFTPDASGELQFIGSNLLAHTASNAQVALPLGKAFDLNITQRRTSYQKTFDGAIIGLEIKVTNSGKSKKTLDIFSNFGTNWTVISSTYPIRQKDAGSGQWRFDIAGNNTTLFNLQVRLLSK